MSELSFAFELSWAELNWAELSWARVVSRASSVSSADSHSCPSILLCGRAAHTRASLSKPYVESDAVRRVALGICFLDKPFGRTQSLSSRSAQPKARSFPFFKLGYHIYLIDSCPILSLIIRGIRWDCKLIDCWKWYDLIVSDMRHMYVCTYTPWAGRFRHTAQNVSFVLQQPLEYFAIIFNIFVKFELYTVEIF